MKKTLTITCLLLWGFFFCGSEMSAQNCEKCTKSLPTQIYTSGKNAVFISGPPDGKGKPVEYHIFTQSKEGAWKFETSGVIHKPGIKDNFKYYRPAQLMVLVFCETPFGSMVEFSNVKMSGPSGKD